LEESADLIILDDKDARKIAKNLSLNVIGTLGILILAKRRDIIRELKPILGELKEKGFYIKMINWSNVFSKKLESRVRPAHLIMHQPGSMSSSKRF